MSGNPSIVVRFTTNVREFLKGTDQVETALTDLEVESGSLAAGVEADTERIERSFRDLASNVKRSSRQAGDAVDTEFRSSARDAAKESGKEAGAEFASNLGESLAQGDLSGLGRDTAAGLIAGFVGMGGAIGVGLAAATVPITAWFAKRTAEAEKLKEAIVSAFDALKANEGAIDEAFLKAEFDRVFQADPQRWAQTARTLQEAGLSAGTIRDAIAGASGASDEVRKAYDRALAKADRLRATVNTTTGAENRRAGIALDAAEAQAKAAREVLKQNGYLEAGVTAYQTYAELAERGRDAERERLKYVRETIRELEALARKSSPGSPASARIAAELDNYRRETTRNRPGGGTRP